MQNGVVSGPATGGQNLLYNYGRTAYFNLLPWDTQGLEQMPILSDSNYYQGYFLYPQGFRGAPAIGQWLNENNTTQGKYYGAYMAGRADLTLSNYNTNKASYADFPFLFYDPNESTAAYSGLPSQYHFTAVDATYCTTLTNVTCFANEGWDHIISKSDWTSTGTVLMAHNGFLAQIDHTDALTGGEYQIGRNALLMAGDVQYGIIGAPYGNDSQNDILVGIGTNTYGPIQSSGNPLYPSSPSTPTTFLRWAGGSNASGDASSRYAYFDFDISGAYTSAANITLAQREVVHFKKATYQDYIVSHTTVALSSGNTINEYWHYEVNGSTCGTIMSGFSTSAPRTVTDTQASSMLISTFLPVAGASSLALIRDNINFSYTGGNGYTCRVRTAASSDGSTANSSATAYESIVVHLPCNGTGCTMPTITQPSCTATGGNCAAVQIADSGYPKVAVFARAGVTLTGVSFTTTHSATAQYLIMGLAPGSYTVTDGSGSTPCTVIANDNTCYFESVSGAVTIGTGGGSAPGAAPQLLLGQ